MKKLLFILPAAVISFFILTGQKATDESPRWIIDPRSSVILSTGEYTNLPANNVEIKQFTFAPRYIVTPIGVFTATPNVRVHPSSQNQQCETDITRHPTNPNIMFATAQPIINSNNFINVGVYVTTDGGVSWRGRDTMNAPNLNDQRGDPTPVIDKNGNFIYGHLLSATNFGGLTGMGANYSTDNGVTWSSTFTVISDANVDKNMAGTDGSPSSPYYGNTYMAWTIFSGNLANGRVARTTNGGVSWDPAIVLNSTPAGHFAQGHDVAVAPNGNVFVCWTAGVTSSPFTEDYVGIAKSTNGGANWVATENAYDVNGSRSSSFNGWAIRTNGFPRIDIDKSGGARNGWIYIVTSQINLAPAGSDADIIINRSTDNGVTWSSPGIRVNQDPLNNGKVQYFPVINVDDFGGLNVVYYDNRNFPSSGDSCSVYMSRSLDGGNTWTDIEVADHHFRPKNLPGINTMGDYIGVTSGNGKVWPVWMDDKAGPGVQFNIWTTSVQIANYPLNAFNLTSPAAGSRIVSFPNSTTQSNFSWDTSASTASYKWIFGSPTTSPRKITLPTTGNSLTITAGQLDNILAGLGLNQGDSLVGQWDIWAFQNNATNDSLKAANGPRAITLKRGVPLLTTFNLSSPSTGTTIQTTPNDFNLLRPNWTRSGQGVKYKWKYAVPNFSTPANVKAIYDSDNLGFDTVASIRISKLDSLAASIGVGINDSVSGQWRVYAYSAADSLASVQTYDLRIRRLPLTTITIGSGTADESYPLNRFYNYFRWQGIYLGSEIGTTGSIRKIRFYQNNSVSGVTNDNLRIFMKSTPDSLLPTGAWDTTGTTLVFSGSTTSLAAPGWQEITLLTPFFFNPSQNLMVATCRDFQQFVSTYPRYAYTTTGTNYRSRRGQSDTQFPASLTQSFNRANVQFEMSLITSVGNEFTSIPDVFALSQNYPNPFNPATVINYQLPVSSFTSLKIFDITGREVATLVNEKQNPGSYSVQFDGSNFSSGVYFYRIESNDFVQTKRMVLIK